MKPLVAASFLIGVMVTIAHFGEARAADPTTADCLSANESSIALRTQHKLRDARARLLVCSAASCPGDIRDECIRRVAEVNASIPTIVFETKDAAGNDLSAVKVTMDGEPLVERLEGTALSIDPGRHIFVFNTAGPASVQKEFVIREGEKERRERIAFATSQAGKADAFHLLVPSPTGDQSSPPHQADETTAVRRNRQRLGALVAGGVGVVGLGIGAGFGLSSLSKHHDAANACPSSQCPDQKGVDLWNNARSAGNVATVGFIIGTVGLAGGGALWFLSKPDSEKPGSTQVGFGPGTVQLTGIW